MKNRIVKFLGGESGAVTVDWVVLTAAVVGLAGLAFTSIQTATGGLGSSTGASLSGTEVGE
ncbi:hypothetical protein [Heliomarina baculiformis]|uniref:hypothetical protein n=1 Tax=Heliomarina baculiformis TaxID=2872036 RepID=UPI001EE3841C|nr:hypothetical protein [Heliomarina baculiformis]